jgi:hypothetical protein
MKNPDRAAAERHAAPCSAPQLLRRCTGRLLAVLAAAGLADAGAQPRADWWSQLDHSARELVWAINDAERTGDRLSQTRVAVMFVRGRGSQEGAKIDLARYWISQAVAKGDQDAQVGAAVFYAMSPESNPELAAEYLAKAGKHGGRVDAADAKRSGSACEASIYCREFPTLFRTYIGLFTEYPLSARRREVEVDAEVTIDFENRSMRVNGKIEPEFERALQDVVNSAFARLGLPKEFDSKGKKIALPVQFRLQD